MARFDATAADEMYDAAQGLERLATSFEDDPGFAGATIVEEHVEALRPFQERVIDSGFTAEELQDLHDQEFEDSEIAQLRAQIETLDLDAVPVNTPLAVVARRAATALREAAPAFDAIARNAFAVAQSTDSAPAAGFDMSPPTGAAPLEVTFTDTSTDADGDALQVTWEFGDGQTAAGTTAKHTFGVGTYNVTQTVSDGTVSASTTRSLTVQPQNADPIASFSATPTEGRRHWRSRSTPRPPATRAARSSRMRRISVTAARPTARRRSTRTPTWALRGEVDRDRRPGPAPSTTWRSPCARPRTQRGRS